MQVRTVLAALLVLGFWHTAAALAEIFGPNLAGNSGFETVDAQGWPTGWRLTAHPAGCGKAGADDRIVLAGKRSLRLHLAAAGSLQILSAPIAVEGGQTYLFSIGFRSEGFGKPGAYSGVDSSTSFEWLDAGGKSLTRSQGVAFPYAPSDWDLRDCLVQAPAGAAQAVVSIHFGNNSLNVAKENIPSTLWADGIQLRAYTAPPTPDWAKGKAQRTVEGGWDSSAVKSYDLSAMNYAGGKWSTRVTDPDSTFGTALASPQGVGQGIMAHSPYFPGARPGLYRAVLRCKIANPQHQQSPGFLQIGSELASGRGQLALRPQQFTAANAYQDFAVDFILRTPGYWMFLVHTEGNQVFTADSVRVFPLALFSDRQLLEMYPGSDGVIAANLQPKRDGPFSTLLVAGLMYDYWRIVPALRLTDYRAKLTGVCVQRRTSQTFLGFPQTAEELFAHDLICLCNVDCSCLSLRQKRMLVEYVRRGGGLLVLGGHKALDRGGMGGSVLDELLPVACPESALPPLLHVPAGAPLQKAAPHPVTQDTDLSAAPVCFWMHPLTPRDGSQTLLTAAAKPAVVAGRFGKGRVACVPLTCMGDPTPGQTPFWQWSGWTTFLRDLCWWTAGRNDHFDDAR